MTTLRHNIALDKSRESIRKTDANLIGSILRGRKNSLNLVPLLLLGQSSSNRSPILLVTITLDLFFVRYLDAGNVNISPKKRPHCFWATLNSEHHLLTQGWGKNGIIWVQLVQMRRGKKLWNITSLRQSYHKVEHICTVYKAKFLSQHIVCLPGWFVALIFRVLRLARMIS